MNKSMRMSNGSYTQLVHRLREILLLSDNVDAGDDVARWRVGVLHIVLFFLWALCVGVIVISLADALRLGNFQALALMLGSGVTLSFALRWTTRYPRFGAVAVLVLLYIIGLWIFFCARNPVLPGLGLVLLYVAPQIALISFGIRTTLALMLVNSVAMVWLLLAPQVQIQGDKALPHALTYVHLLLFLLLNVAMPLAFFSVYAALTRGAARYLRVNRLLRKSNALYEDMFEHAGGPALICDQRGAILKANGGALALFECALVDSKKPLTLTDLLEALPLGLQPEALLRVARSSGSSDGEFAVRQAAGREVMLNVKSLSARCSLIGITDLSRLRTTQRELQAVQAAHDRLVSFDHLTNLPNRDYLLEKLRELMHRCDMAADGNPVAVVCMRLNSIRSVNEKYGQHAGDELVCEFARELSLRGRPQIIPCRLRGAMFALLAMGYRNQEQLLNTVENFIDALPRHCELGGKSIELSISIGMAFSRGDIAVNELIHRAEKALETARKTVQRKIVIFSEDIGQEFHREIEVEIALSSAMQRRELSLVYQPKVSAQRRVEGLEALLRWQSPELGTVSPAEFIPLAERNGKIHALTDFVIESVCAQQRAWLDRHGKTWPVAVNLSGLDLQRENIVGVIADAAQRHALTPALLQLEITETGLIENDEVARSNLEKLIEAGFHIAIDDFGTGYSSLKKLSEYAVNTIKIDRSFVLSIGENPRSEQIIRLILTLAKFLNCETVAEGVETQEQLRFLLDNGCMRFQGYLFFEPLPRCDIETLLAEISA